MQLVQFKTSFPSHFQGNFSVSPLSAVKGNLKVDFFCFVCLAVNFIRLHYFDLHQVSDARLQGDWAGGWGERDLLRSSCYTSDI